MRKTLFYFSVTLLFLSASLLIYKYVSPQEAKNTPSNSTTSLSTITTTLPTHQVDLSSMLITADKDATISLMSSSKENVGEISILQPLTAPNGTISGPPQKQLIYQQPLSGVYTLKLSSTLPVSVSIYLYDMRGNVLTRKFEEIHNNGDIVFSIIFDKEHIANSSIIKQ